MRQLLFALAFLCAATPAFAQKGGETGGVPDRVIDYSDADARMNAAIEQARASLPMFLQEFQDAPAAQRGAFALKLGVPTPAGGREHMWINNLRYEGDDLVGDLANEPYDIPDLRIGARIVIVHDDISDWSIASAQGLYGAFTTRVMVDDLSPQDAAQYRAMLAPTPLPPHWRT